MAESRRATRSTSKFFPRGSVIILDELAAYRRDNLNMGLGWTAASAAEAIRSELCDKWKVETLGRRRRCVLREERPFERLDRGRVRAKGVRFQPAKKADRISGWQRMKRMLADAGKPDRPGLYVSRACEYFWATVPYLARDQRRVEDVDSGPDHAADACRYGLLRQQWAMDLSFLKIASTGC